MGFPLFLDFEASSLGPNSYPIEVAWSDADGKIESHLINPYYFKDWDDWSFSASTMPMGFLARNCVKRVRRHQR